MAPHPRTPRAPPTTRFAQRRRTGHIDLASIDWKQVVAHESHNVANWLSFLSSNTPSRRVAYTLIITLVEDLLFLKNTASWPVYMRTGLPCVVLDIICSGNVFLHSGESFDQTKAYMETTFSLLGRCIMNLLDSGHDPLAMECGREVLVRAEEFYQVVWDNRNRISTIPPESQDMNYNNTSNFRSIAPLSGCVISMVTLYTLHHQRPPPLSMCAGKFLLYCWTYSPKFGTCSFALEHLYIIFSSDDANVSAFTADMLLSHRRFGEHLAVRLSDILRSQAVLNLAAYRVFSLMKTLLSSRLGIAPLADIIARNADHELVTSLLLGCQRQLCSSDGSISRHIVVLTSQILALLLSAGGESHAVKRQILQFAWLYNLTAILCHATVFSIEDSSMEMLHHTLELVRGMGSLISRPGSPVADWKEYLESPMYNNTARIWHEFMLKLRSLPAEGPVQVKMKAHALQVWRLHGLACGMKEDVDIFNSRGPSEPNVDTRYWKIPKRCSWNACPCSVTVAFHSVRVCRGCFRVLYCGKMCQEKDWEAGHKLLCKPSP
ncbi:hypothetical protein BXZ70DRAFT_935594 [Cristinia sonorae]|uniref:MYND-type domain-containing protein n=1 Tax=Cristinia sonorae TaxID=1940300 RepID=A0A8K0UQS3_9AGAR|nr:hypothetical protein BXZ70DRAFT_935594 [Cristinia sonorae]